MHFHRKAVQHALTVYPSSIFVFQEFLLGCFLFALFIFCLGMWSPSDILFMETEGFTLGYL